MKKYFNSTKRSAQAGSLFCFLPVAARQRVPGYSVTQTRQVPPPGSLTPEPSERPQGLGVRWLAWNGADTVSVWQGWTGAKAVCARTPHPPRSKTRARQPVCALVQGFKARKNISRNSHTYE